ELDGFRDPVVHPIAAAPPEGDPVDIDQLMDVLDERLVAKRADQAKLVEDLHHVGRSLAADAGVWEGTPDDAHDRVRGAAGDSELLAAEMEELGISGPTADEIEAVGDDLAAIDQTLRRRAGLAATVAALGVACAEIRAQQGRRT
ncbi:MAG: hypothetical protein ABFS21_08400, partial [Actinomycetota bacterium]